MKLNYLQAVIKQTRKVINKHKQLTHITCSPNQFYSITGWVFREWKSSGCTVL